MGIYSEIKIKVDGGYEIEVLEELIKKFKEQGVKDTHSVNSKNQWYVVEVTTNKRW